ncbi:MAG: hypothetical protein QOD46_833 [Actinomycetota bacterium]|nr:hypothetical protein [Actinomycetota bacterium]
MTKGALSATRIATALMVAVVTMAFATSVIAAPKHQVHHATHGIKPNGVGMLDCNGFSRIQVSVKPTSACADPRGYEGGRFYDNGHYIGHDEPIVRFVSNRRGTGNRTVWRETLPRDPKRRPTVHEPGRDITHWFELSVAPWFSMALCNSLSFPLNQPCTPNSDSNAPSPSKPGGAGSSFLEMQFYPPGEAPFVDNISCDNTHWCASLHINDAECDIDFNCNPNCVEPTNFAFIQRDGVPTGPPGPQLANLSSFTPNGETLLMNPGDKIIARIFDADIGGGQRALETRIDDLTTGQSGYMIASADNGFMATDPNDCSGVPFNYEPEYKTAARGNVIGWAALQTNISTDFEIGHWIPCTKIDDPVTQDFGGGITDTAWTDCSGPYERAAVHSGLKEGNQEGPCYPEGDTHDGLASPPNLVTGCDYFFGTDVDYDGTSYWPDWPNRRRPHRHPSPFLQRPPLSGHRPYSQYQFQTEAPASELTCKPTGKGCKVPPPGAPGHFYPYWTLARVHDKCVFEFGQMSNGRTFGKTKQYGKPALDWFFANLEGPFRQVPHC